MDDNSELLIYLSLVARMQGTMQLRFSLQFHTATSDSDVDMDGSSFNRPGCDATAQISQAQESRVAAQWSDCRESIDTLMHGLRSDMKELLHRYSRSERGRELSHTRPDIDSEEMPRSLAAFNDIMSFTKDCVLRNRGIEESRDANVGVGLQYSLPKGYSSLQSI